MTFESRRPGRLLSNNLQRFAFFLHVRRLLCGVLMLFEILRHPIEDAEDIKENESGRAHYKEKHDPENHSEDYEE